MLCSDALRTRKTWSGIAPALPGSPVLELKPALYHARADVVMMIGHNPGITEFAAKLVARAPQNPEFARYPTGATLVADFAIDSWDQLGWGSGVVDDFIIPREIVM